jgi:LPXTG-motif cell wall-anchored protein
MYKGGLGAGVAAVTTGTALTLPNTGSSLIINLALSVGAGLLVWGFVYTRTQTNK